ncbi:hypothetical protein RJT34_03705 [Clitoria ternatea]|uniref:Protein kinase domain-containing protein n=1 Tax=Clitoria ternatea TaxID=43366 RepID=A0AAN9Q1H8_CLITE
MVVPAVGENSSKRPRRRNFHLYTEYKTALSSSTTTTQEQQWVSKFWSLTRASGVAVAAPLFFSISLHPLILSSHLLPELDKNLSPHLTHFGLAEYKNDFTRVSIENWKSSGKPTGGFHKKNMVGTLIYMAPEVLKKDLHTEKSDVYSFSVSINELLTGVVPYTDLRAEAQQQTIGRASRRSD